MLRDSRYIDSMTMSLLSPYVPARQLTCDALTFLCYCDIPNGHSMVLRGMELLKKRKDGEGRFDIWLDSFERILDARGKMGSLVGTDRDFFKLTGISENPEEHLMEYGVSSSIQRKKRKTLILVHVACKYAPDQRPCRPRRGRRP